MDIKPIKVVATEKASEYEDAGVLLSRLGDRGYLEQFNNIRNMSKSEILFPIDVDGVHFFGKAVKLSTGWKVFARKAFTVDKERGMTRLMSVAEFFASDRFKLEELMYALYFQLMKIAKEKDEDGGQID